MFSNPRSLSAAVLLCLAVLMLPGCDKGPEQLAKAEAQYAGLVQRGVHPKDPAYDEVIAAFEAIPRDSKARPEADRRLAALRALRGNLPPRPLATPGATGPGTTKVDAKRAQCEMLAKELGTVKEAQRKAVIRALEQCREALARLEADAHPPGEHGDEHAPEAERDGGR